MTVVVVFVVVVVVVVQVFSLGTEVSPVEIATQALQLCTELQASTGVSWSLIVDTAGRQVVDGPLMEELANVKKAVSVMKCDLRKKRK